MIAQLGMHLNSRQIRHRCDGSDRLNVGLDFVCTWLVAVFSANRGSSTCASLLSNSVVHCRWRNRIVFGQVLSMSMFHVHVHVHVRRSSERRFALFAIQLRRSSNIEDRPLAISDIGAQRLDVLAIRHTIEAFIDYRGSACANF